MSLGVGASIAVSDQSATPKTTLDVITYGMNGGLVALGLTSTGASLEAIWTGDERGTDYENHIAPEDGVMTEFYINIFSNTYDADVNVYLSKNTGGTGFQDHQSGVYSDLILTIPQGFTGVLSAIGLELPIVKGFYYAPVFDPDGAGISGSIGHRQSYKMEFGNNPIQPTKFVKLNRELETSEKITEQFFNFNAIADPGSLLNWSQPLPFAGTLTSLAITKFRAPSSPWTFRVYKNGVLADSKVLINSTVGENWNPNVSFVAGDTFCFSQQYTVAFGQQAFINLSAGWELA